MPNTGITPATIRVCCGRPMIWTFHTELRVNSTVRVHYLFCETCEDREGGHEETIWTRPTPKP